MGSNVVPTILSDSGGTGASTHQRIFSQVVANSVGVMLLFAPLNCYCHWQRTLYLSVAEGSGMSCYLDFRFPTHAAF